MYITAKDIITKLDRAIQVEWHKNPGFARECIVMNEDDAEMLYEYFVTNFPMVGASRKNMRYMGFRILRTPDLARTQFVVTTKKEFEY